MASKWEFSEWSKTPWYLRIFGYKKFRRQALYHFTYMKDICDDMLIWQYSDMLPHGINLKNYLKLATNVTTW